MTKKPLQITLAGGSGRAETGAVQFKNDWPGLFVRGDAAVSLAIAIRYLQQRLTSDPDALTSHYLSRLGVIADIIEQQVKV